jgi:hypothetical protein
VRASLRWVRLKSDAELLLELSDLLAYCRLRDVQTLRSLAEVKWLSAQGWRTGRTRTGDSRRGRG